LDGRSPHLAFSLIYHSPHLHINGNPPQFNAPPLLFIELISSKVFPFHSLYGIRGCSRASLSEPICLAQPAAFPRFCCEVCFNFRYCATSILPRLPFCLRDFRLHQVFSSFRHQSSFSRRRPLYCSPFAFYSWHLVYFVLLPDLA